MKIRVVFLIVLFLFVLPIQVRANLVSECAEEIMESFAKKGLTETSHEIVEFGGKAVVQETLEKAAQEGGDGLVAKVVRYGENYGIAAIRVIDRAPALYVNALENMPKDLVERAVWAAERDPAAIKTLLQNYGPDVLLISAKHRGIGVELIQKLGEDGIRIGKTISENQAITVVKHADEIASLPSPQRSKVVDAILKAPGRVIDCLERHPKTLHTLAGAGIIIAIADKVLGDSEEVTTNRDGSKTVRHRGIIERILERHNVGSSTFSIILALILGGWGCIKIWSQYRKEAIKIQIAQVQYQKKQQKGGD